MRHIGLAAIVLAWGGVASVQVQGAVISTIGDFTSPSQWTISYAASGGTNESTATATTLKADKSGATGGVGVEASLVGSISTAGYKNITLTFNWANTGDLEFGTFNYGGASDGFSATTTQGPASVSSASLGDPASGASGTATLVFGEGAFDSAITNLVIRANVNAGDEVITLSNFSVNGEAVPEPASLSLLAMAGLVGLRRRRAAR